MIPRERAQELIERCRYRIDVCYGHMDRHLAEHEWVMPSGFSMADCALAPALFYAQQTAPFAARANIGAYWERLCGRPTWQRVMQEAQPYLEKLQAQSAA